MALNLSSKYPGRANPPSVDYPEGSIKNQTAPGAKDGTPLDADWANDKEGFFQSLLYSAGVTANGEVDKVGSSQYFDALRSSLAASKSDVNNGVLLDKYATPSSLNGVFSIGQSKQVLTSSRSAGVVYTNTTGRPIFVQIRGLTTAATSSRLSIAANGGEAAVAYEPNADRGVGVSTVVFPGESYSCSATGALNITLWIEYR